MSKGSSRRRLTVDWNSTLKLWTKRPEQDGFFELLEPFSETWPASGSMRNGRAWARTRSALPTADAASSSTPGRLLPTPRPQTKGGCSAVENPPNRQGGPNLATAIALLPTPRTSDTNGIGEHGTGGMDLRTAISLLPTPRARDGKGKGYEDQLPNVVALLPTPMVGDATGTRNATAGRTNPDSQHHPGWTLSDVVFAGKLMPTPRATDGTKGGPNQRGSKGDLMLPSVAAQLLPTPRATRGGSATETMYSLGAERTDESRPQGEVLLPTPTASDSERTSSSYGRGNPTLTGAITNPPSDGGNESSDDPPPGPPTLWDD
jgi:hypothetical protein